MTRPVALFVALALLVSAAACKGDDDGSPRAGRTTTTSSTASTSTTTTPAATTTSALAVAAGGCDAAALTRAQPREDRTVYDVDVEYRPGPNLVLGEFVAHFTPDKDTDRVYMRLWPNGPDSTAHGGKIELAGAFVNDELLPLALANPTTAVIEKPLIANKRVKVRVHMRLTLPVGSDDRLTRQGDVVRLGSWLPLLPWEPGVGWALEPPTSSYAEASLSAHANFNVTLRVPQDLTVISSGSLTGAPDWAAVIGRFKVVNGNANGVPVSVALEETMTGSSAPYLEKVIASIDDHARRYGKYPWPAYNLVLTPGMRGGIEYPGLVMQGPDTNARTTAHEVSHQWFYGLVGSNQGRDPWLDEGLATWGEAQFEGTMASFRSRPIPADGRNRLGQPMTYWDAHRSSYYRSVYVQGLQALSALGVSTAAVDCALARYVAANAYRVATPQALADALKTVAPDAAAVLARYGAQRVT